MKTFISIAFRIKDIDRHFDQSTYNNRQPNLVPYGNIQSNSFLGFRLADNRRDS